MSKDRKVVESRNKNMEFGAYFNLTEQIPVLEIPTQRSNELYTKQSHYTEIPQHQCTWTSLIKKPHNYIYRNMFLHPQVISAFIPCWLANVPSQNGSRSLAVISQRQAQTKMSSGVLVRVQ